MTTIRTTPIVTTDLVSLVKISDQKSGMYSLFAQRSSAGTEYGIPEIAPGFDRVPGLITRISRTEAQPLVCASFSPKGEFIGGRTLTEAEYLAAYAKAAQAGRK